MYLLFHATFTHSWGLDDILLTKEQSESITAAYIQRFGELSLFKRYLPFISGVLGSEKFIKKDAFYALRHLGVRNTVIDLTLFAAMFSIGTLFIRCVGDIRRHEVEYSSLTPHQKRRFIIEAVRLFPTVTTTHRIVEAEESYPLGDTSVTLTAGDEVVYPIVCANTDDRAFSCPHAMDLERPEEEVDKVLSWSKGPHACPARDLSIQVTMVMLDALAEHTDLASIDYGESLV